MTHIHDLEITTLPMKVFPKDDGCTYLYKRVNGKTYYYHNGIEVEIPTYPTFVLPNKIINHSTIDVTKNIIGQIENVSLPDTYHKFMFLKGNDLYCYDKDGIIYPIRSFDYTIKEW